MTASFGLSDDRRSAWVGGALVGAVVLVLGFGSGIGSIVSHQRTAYQASGPTLRGGAGSPPTGVAVAVTPPPTEGATTTGSLPDDGRADLAHSHGGNGVTAATPAPATPSSVAAAPAPNTAAPSSGATPVACQTQNVVSAMLAPLMTHLEKAHLETSPGQQVADLVNVDQYTKTHTVLLESILSPLIDVVMALPAGLLPLMTHLDKAHLETSPGQQVADLLSVDQYVKTHTVLAEAILAPAADTAMGTSGC